MHCRATASSSSLATSSSSSAAAAHPGTRLRFHASPNAAVGPHLCLVPRRTSTAPRPPRERCAGAGGDYPPGYIPIPLPAYPSPPAYTPTYPSAPEMPASMMPPDDRMGDRMGEERMGDGRMGETARTALIRATYATKRYGWISFWVQLTLSVISGVILLFSVAFTSQTGPRASLYLTLVGILAGFLSTFWNYGYTRTALKMQAYLDAPRGSSQNKIKKQNVIDMVTKGVSINMLGLGSTLLGIQALVGVLVAKTLSNSSANPFIASAAGVYNPVLALDVFLVQAATNTLLGHFLSLACSLWLLNVIGEGRGLRFQSSSSDKSDSVGSGASSFGYRPAPAVPPVRGY